MERIASRLGARIRGKLHRMAGWLLPRTRWGIAQKAEMDFWRRWFLEHPDGNDDRWLQTVLDYFELKAGQNFGSETVVDIGAGPIGVLSKLKAATKIAVDPLDMDSLDKSIRRIRAPGEATIQKRTQQMDCYFDHPHVPGSGYSILCLIVRKAEAVGQ